MIELAPLLRAARVLPVLTIERLDDALPLADALAEGGFEILEITLRTDVALAAIRRLRTERPQLTIGAGTVLSPEKLTAATEAGAMFAVSPGTTSALLRAASDARIPYLPAVATVSEAMTAREAGHRLLKFFPAKSSGGPAALQSWVEPLPDLTFCPTGGVDAASAVEYLKLANVICVGGSWMVPRDAIARGDWQRIARLARQSRSA